MRADAERAAASPFGTPIAHGLERVRFPAPVPVGSRVRGRFDLLACEPLAGGMPLTIKVTVEREGSDRPVCVAEVLSRRFAPIPNNGPQRRSARSRASDV